MIGGKRVFTPLSTSTNLKLIDDTTLFENFEFRSVIGSVRYLSLTHPNKSFLVHKLFTI